MRKQFAIGLLVLALMAFGFSAVHAQGGTGFPPTNTITVSGTGTAYGEPDVAYVELGVEEVNENLGDAFSSTADAMNAVIEALVELGIARDDIQTTGVNVFPEDRWDPQTGTSTGRVYRVRNTVRVTVREIGQIESVITTAVEAGANTIYNLNFGIDDPSALEQEARVNAVEDARARAERLAEALGVTVGEPVIITEVLQGGGIPFARFEGMGGAGLDLASQPVSPGQLGVSVQVQITFAMGGESE